MVYRSTFKLSMFNHADTIDTTLKILFCIVISLVRGKRLTHFVALGDQFSQLSAVCLWPNTAPAQLHQQKVDSESKINKNRAPCHSKVI